MCHFPNQNTREIPFSRIRPVNGSGPGLAGFGAGTDGARSGPVYQREYHTRLVYPWVQKAVPILGPVVSAGSNPFTHTRNTDDIKQFTKKLKEMKHPNSKEFYTHDQHLLAAFKKKY